MHYIEVHFSQRSEFGVSPNSSNKKSISCNTQRLTDFSRALRKDIFSKIGMGKVRGITKNVPNLQVYEPPPATPTTLSIKVVIVVLY